MSMTRPLRAVPMLVLATALLLALANVAVFAQATSLTIEGTKAHYHTDDEATLTAVQAPDPGEHHGHWFVRKDGASDFEVVPVSSLTRTRSRCPAVWARSRSRPSSTPRSRRDRRVGCNHHRDR